MRTKRCQPYPKRGLLLSKLVVALRYSHWNQGKITCCGPSVSLGFEHLWIPQSRDFLFYFDWFPPNKRITIFRSHPLFCQMGRGNLIFSKSLHCHYHYREMAAYLIPTNLSANTLTDLSVDSWLTLTHQLTHCFCFGWCVRDMLANTLTDTLLGLHSLL